LGRLFLPGRPTLKGVYLDEENKKRENRREVLEWVMRQYQKTLVENVQGKKKKNFFWGGRGGGYRIITLKRIFKEGESY
jgi:hypothetical protein